MDRLFITVLNMSITASCVLAVVLVLRLILQRMKVPKWMVCLLWIAVFFRLLCPVALTSEYSLLQYVPQREGVVQSSTQMEYITPDVYVQQLPVVAKQTDVVAEPSVVQPTQEMERVAGYGETGGVGFIMLLPVVWFIGVLLFAAYSGWRWYRLRQRVATATRVADNIYESDRVASPFVMGLLRPKIYLPLGLAGETREYIVLHEQSHIRRGDLWWKAIAQIALILHWFNPLVYGAYYLLGQDLEQACDEKVVACLGSACKADYSRTLLAMSVANRHLLTPLAFGESRTKQRVKNILQYARPTAEALLVWVIIGIMVAVSCLSNPIMSSSEENLYPRPKSGQTLLQQAYWKDQKSNLLDLYQILFADDPLNLAKNSIELDFYFGWGERMGQFTFRTKSAQGFDELQKHCAAQYMEMASFLYQLESYDGDVFYLNSLQFMGTEMQICSQSERKKASYTKEGLHALLDRVELSLSDEQVEQAWQLGQRIGQQQRQMEVIAEQFSAYDLSCDIDVSGIDQVTVRLYQSETAAAVERNEVDYRKLALLIFSCCPDWRELQFDLFGRYFAASEDSGSWELNYQLQYSRAELEQQYGVLKLDTTQPVKEQLQRLLAQVQPIVRADIVCSPQMELADRLRRVEFNPLVPSASLFDGIRGERHCLRFSLLTGQFPKEDGCYLQMDFVTAGGYRNTPQLVESTSSLWIYGKQAQWQQTAEPVLQWQTAETGMCSLRYEGAYYITVSRWDQDLREALEALGGEQLAESPSPWTVVYSGKLTFQQQLPQSVICNAAAVWQRAERYSEYVWRLYENQDGEGLV